MILVKRCYYFCKRYYQIKAQEIKRKKGDGLHHHLILNECQMTPLPLFTHLCVLCFPSCAPLIVFFSRALFLFLAFLALYPIFHGVFYYYSCYLVCKPTRATTNYAVRLH